MGSSPTSSSILAYSVTVSTKHFDCFSLGSNPDKPTIITGSRGVRFISLALDARATQVRILPIRPSQVESTAV